MPHLHIKEFKEITFPAQKDGVAFSFMAQNANNEGEKLICTTLEGSLFFSL